MVAEDKLMLFYKPQFKSIKNLSLNSLYFFYKKRVIPYIIITFLFLNSCSTTKYSEKFTNDIKKFNEFYKNEKDSSENNVLVFDNPFKEQRPLCKKANIVTKDIKLRELATLLSYTYKENINYAANLNQAKGLTLNLHDVCLADVLDSLTEIYDIGVKDLDYGYTLYLPQIQTITYEVNYHNFKRKGKSSISIVSSTLKEDEESDNYSTIKSESEDNFWGSVENTIRSILKSTTKNTIALIDVTGEGQPTGQTASTPASLVTSTNNDRDNKVEEFYVYRESGLVVVSAMPSQQRLIKNFLNKVNKNSTRQIIIEAKILEVELREEFSNGIQWDTLKNDLRQSSLAAVSAPFDSINNLHNTSNIAGDELSLNNVLSGRIAAKDFNMVMQALKTQGKLSVISSPRIAVLNNQRALIKSGEDKYFVTNVTNLTTNLNSDNANTQSGFDLEPIFSGVALEATPNIISNDEVIMHIHPMISRVDDEDKLIKIDNRDSRIPVAMILSREVDTVVKSFSGDIIILGGMTQDMVSTNRSGLPFEHDKGIGRIFNLFSANRNASKKIEVIVLIKPTIVNSFDDREDIGSYKL
ncbi:MAG: hypothetical protein HRU35_00520 [Rickettsiaceae bacterium]|nr:hypothetical protein [Rickettsiaceae bacterium]